MENITNAILALSQLHSRLTGTPENADLIQRVKVWGAGIFRVVVMGEIKSGKSSFINALLGVENLVPTASDVATSTIYKIRYGRENAYRVHFEEKTGLKAANISAEEVAAYGTEAGNPGNEKQVDFIEVICNADILKDGLVIIDTPGLGGLFKEHKKITWQHVPKADAVFFVTDSNRNPISHAELEHLKTVREITPHLCFVQTKTDIVTPEDAEKRRNNNLGILSSNLQLSVSEIPYFSLSSELKHIADAECDLELLQISGYASFTGYVRKRLISRLHETLKNRAILRALPLLQELKQNISSRSEILLADSKEKRQAARASIEETKKKFRNWEHNELPALKKDIFRGFKKIQDQCNTYCCRELSPGGNLQAKLESEINKVGDLESLYTKVQIIQARLPEASSICMMEIQKQYESGISELLTAESARLNDTTLAIAQPVNSRTNNLGNSLRRMEQLHNSSRQVKDMLMNGMLGGNVGAWIGGAIGGIVPGIGALIGAAIGGAIGGYWMQQESQTARDAQNLQTAKTDVRNELYRSISNIYSDALRTIQKLNDNCTALIADTLDDTIRKRNQEFENELTNLETRSRMQEKELAEARQKLAEDQAQFKALERVLQTC